jgi:transmembrane sensor
LSERPATPDERQAIDAEASARVARLQAEPGAAERQAVYDWITADPHHAVAFARAEAAWEMSQRLCADPPPMGALPRAGDDALAFLLSRRGLMSGLLAASTAAVVATAAWRYEKDVLLYRTQIGERRIVVLSDGSRVQLNTGSTIEVAMTRKARKIRLVRGEALFEVAHNKARPFLVDAGTAQLRAVGTAFNVRIRDEVVELTVTEGVVAVTSGGQAVRSAAAAPHIAAGGGAVIRPGAVAPTQLDEAEMRQRTAWREGVIELDGETLAQAVDEFNRYRGAPIILGDARLANIRVGGRFEVDEADKFLLALETGFPIRAMPSADGSLLLVAKP